jgi:two-component system osmolarity sensor histidine kinase EnvZ
MSTGTSLFRHSLSAIAVGMVVLILVSGFGLNFLVLEPLAERSADDFAALVVLAASTWEELPPEKRPAFAAQLARDHAVSVREVRLSTGPDADERHRYMHALQVALAHRLGGVEGVRVVEGDGDLFHADVPADGRILRFSFSHDRHAHHPLTTILLTLLTAAVVALVVAWTLAKRVVAPVTQLAAAARKIGLGEQPGLLPETGERELTTLVRAFNETSASLAVQRENLRTLLVGISHDLRSPLARLRMATGVLAEESPSPLVARMEADIDAMDAVIEAQIQLARAREREDARPVDIDALLQEIVVSVTQGRGAASVRVSGPACVERIAPVALRRVLANLIENALHHGKGRALQIVRRRCRRSVFIGVRDRGPGVPLAYREAVFLPYFRVEASRSRATGGSGLGLAIARQLADTQGWKLALKARVGGGASFWLALEAGPRRGEAPRNSGNGASSRAADRRV